MTRRTTRERAATRFPFMPVVKSLPGTVASGSPYGWAFGTPSTPPGGGGGGSYDPLTFGYGPLGSYLPDLTTVGRTSLALTGAGSMVTDSSHNTLVINSGTVIDNTRLERYIDVRTSDPVIFKRCQLPGPPTAVAGRSAIIDCNNPAGAGKGNVFVYDSEIVPQAPNNQLDGIYGNDFTVVRTLFRHCVDGLGVRNPKNAATANVRAELCLFTDAFWAYPDTVGGHPDGTHDEALAQWFGGANFDVIWCVALGFVDKTVSRTSDPAGHPIPDTTNTCIQITNTTGQCSGLNVDGGFMDGGAFMVNIGSKTGGYPNLGTIQNVRFGRGNKYKNGGAIAAPAGKVKIVLKWVNRNNVYDDTGLPIKVAVGT